MIFSGASKKTYAEEIKNAKVEIELTLRDKFAVDFLYISPVALDFSHEYAAIEAYNFADAMMAARSPKKDW